MWLACLVHHQEVQGLIPEPNGKVMLVFSHSVAPDPWPEYRYRLKLRSVSFSHSLFIKAGT